MQQKQREIVEAFYDGFSKRLIRDYLLGNKRIIFAIRFMQEQIRPACTSLLDIGCGIGWSSFEFARFFPGAAVLGVDISSELARQASRLFSQPNLAFRQVDVTSESFSFSNTFDAITLIDIYEHIPQSERKSFHHHLNQLLTADGQVLIASPTPLHQDWLRENHPQGLQPVDEDVTLADMQTLADAVGGQLTVFRYLSIWNTNDYFHALIERQPKYEPLGNSRPSSRISSKAARLLRVLRRVKWRDNPLSEKSTLFYFIKTFFSNH